MVVAAVLGPQPPERGARARRRLLAVLRASRARARADGRRLRVRAVGAPARGDRAPRRSSATCCRTSSGRSLVLVTLDLGNAILLLSGLSFLGLGAQPPTAEWGSMVAEGAQYFQWWWIGTFPGLAIFTVVLAFNFLGDSLRDALRPAAPGRAAARRDEALLEVEGLRVRLRGGARACVTVVDGVDYRVEQGEVFGVAGESGSGKTMSMLALLGLLPDGRGRRGARPLRAGAICSRSHGTQLRRDLRPRARDGLPGPADLAAPDADDRAPADRARAPPPRARAAHGRARARRAARGGADPRRRGGAARLPPPVLGRDAPADRDRDRARLPPASS